MKHIIRQEPSVEDTVAIARSYKIGWIESVEQVTSNSKPKLNYQSLRKRGFEGIFEDGTGIIPDSEEKESNTSGDVELVDDVFQMCIRDSH